MTNTPQNNDSDPWRLMRLAALTLAMALLPTLFAALPTQGQTYTILHSFNGEDGASLMAGLFRDPAGNLYGTAGAGGPFSGDGTVFKLNTAGTLTILHNFKGPEGANPEAGLIRDSAGNFYGTASQGGDPSCGHCGTVFKLYKGTLTTLHTFTGRDGSAPFAPLVRDSAGNLYGTTRQGGALNAGTVFKLDTSGTLTVLHSFGWKTDGRAPWDGLLQDGSGNAYGTTFGGGTSGVGTVFKLNLTTGKYVVLYNFPGAPGGAKPFAGLIRDSAGNLCGTTSLGGDHGHGVIFKLDKLTLAVTVLHSFAGPDGLNPWGGLVRDSGGNLYGTTADGGNYKEGTAFKLDTTGTLTVLHHFGAFTGDGMYPLANLALDPAGNLYGTTEDGGAYGEGTIFKLTP